MRPLFLIGLFCLIAACHAAHAQNPDAQDPDARARQIVAQMTLDEKIQELHGFRDSGHYRTVQPIPRLGIPELNITNGPAGTANGGPGHQGHATALPAPISLAAAWDRSASELYGRIAGQEAADLANGLLEAPDVNIARLPQNGRTFEAFGEDPYLAGEMAASNILGIQSQGVIANVKHYAGNNQEMQRGTISDDVGERTLREIYLPAFEAAIKQGHVGSLMGAYNKVNGTYCCENALLMDTILKKEWGWDGFVTSDFGAVHSTVPSALAGLDLEMPTGKYFDAALKAAVESGQVPAAVIDDKLIRRFRTMIQLGVFDHPPAKRPIPEAEDGAQARLLAEEGMVLLKNDRHLLPLDARRVHSIALIGPYALSAATGGGGSSRVNPFYTVAPLKGIQDRVGPKAAVQLADGKDVAQAAAIAKAADVAIVMVGDRETEGRDHSIALDGNQDALVEAVAAANRRTIVVLKTGSAVLMPWVDHTPVILEAWYPGEEDGNAVAAVLFGDLNPGGKLPITFPRRLEDLPANTPAQYPGVDGVAHYSEGVFVGYRHFDAAGIAPLFPFGHGLSYTTFAYRNLRLTSTRIPAGAGTNPVVSVDFDLRNTGRRAGAEVAQIYVAMPSSPAVPEPPAQLKGFVRAPLNRGQTTHVHLDLDDRAFSFWDTGTHGWRIAPGTYGILVGSSSRDIRLRGQVTISSGTAAIATGAAAVATDAAAAIFVASAGDDANPGTRDRPVHTLQRARDLARKRNRNMKGDLTVFLAGGVYRLSDPLSLGPEDSGTHGHRIIYAALPGERPVISGGVQVTGWKLVDAARNLWSAPAPPGLKNTRQLYVNGVRAQRTRGRLPTRLTETPTGYTAEDPTMANWRNPGDIEFVYTGGNSLWSEHSSGLGAWTEPRCPVAIIQGTAITMAQPCWNNSTQRVMLPPGSGFKRSANLVGPSSVGKQPEYVENAYELLGTPGQWYFDRAAGVLYYVPRPGEDLTTADVEAPVLEALVTGQGAANNPVHDIAFSGIQFSYATWLAPGSPEGFSEIQANYRVTGPNGYAAQGLCSLVPNGQCPFGDWTKEAGNVSFRYDRGIQFLNDAFVHLGAAGLDLGDGSQADTVQGCVFTDISGNGLEIGGVDLPLGAGGDITRDNQILDNHIYSVAAEYHGGVGIDVGYTQRTRIEHNQINHLPYTGISLGWGGWLDKIHRAGQANNSRDNTVAHNLIFDHLLVLADGGGIYTQGLTGPSLANGEKLTGNVIYDQFSTGHGIYTDNGCKNVTAIGNVLFRTNHDNWGGRHRDYYDNHAGKVYDAFEFRNNFWQQGDRDSSREDVTLQGNHLIDALEEAPAAILQDAGLETAYRGILKDSFGTPGAPEPPMRVSACAGDGFACVSFSPPVLEGGAPVDSYTVTSSRGDTATISAADFHTQGYVKLAGLTNGTAITFTAAATNTNGSSAPSLPSSAVRPGAGAIRPPGPPQHASVDVADGKASIHFQAPADNGGSPILAYVFTVNPGGRRGVLTGRKALTLDGRHATFGVVDGLTNGQAYIFEVAAINAAGEGAAAQAAGPATTGPATTGPTTASTAGITTSTTTTTGAASSGAEKTGPAAVRLVQFQVGSARDEITGGQSQWVHRADGRLVYKTLPRGDRIMDFSSAGYGGGGVPIPVVPVKMTLRPSGGDDTAAIQGAIDAVSGLPPTDGIRGAVLLSPGTFDCRAALTIRASGVVLRGSGSGPGGTILRLGGKPHVGVTIVGPKAAAAAAGVSTLIADAHVPSGSTSFHVANPAGFALGDTVLIRRPVTTAWVHFMGMDTLVRNGKKERWLSGAIGTERVIRKIVGNEVTLDVPLSDSFDSSVLNPPGASVEKIQPPDRITQVGAEDLRIAAPPQTIRITDPQYQALRMDGAADAWFRDIAIEDTIDSVAIGGHARRVTVENVAITHTTATVGAAKPADFAVSGTQTLFRHCSSRGDNLFYFVTGARATGPNVLLDCTFHGNGHIQPHQRWATGLLLDRCAVPESGIDLMNRGEMGSGHGWTIGWSVAWNCTARSFVIQQPPGSANWAIGCRGNRMRAVMPFGQGPELPEGIFDSHGVPVAPSSLYLAQLQDRTGDRKN